MSQERNGSVLSALPWWLHPVPVFVGLNGLTAVAAFLARPDTYLELWRTPKYFDGFTALLTAAAITAFSMGVWLVSAKQSQEARLLWPGSISFSRLLLLFNISFWVSTLAYVFWTALGVSRGLGLTLLKSIFFGGDVSIYALRESLSTIPGLTTWTQADIAAVVLGCIIGANRGWRIVRGKLTVLALLALVRALLYSERLAFLELAVPFLVLWFGETTYWRQSRTLRRLTRFAPALGAVLIYAIFTGFETFRSWSIYYRARESSLTLFGFWRLVGYYVTSINNSAYMLTTLHHPLGAPYLSLPFLWEFPVLNTVVKGVFSWMHLDYLRYMELLRIGANPEFNNPGGLLSPVVDLGVLGGLAYWAVMGLLTGYLYSLFVRKHPLGMCIYPVFYLTLTELPRYIYWGEGRAVPALAYLLLSAMVLVRSARVTRDDSLSSFHPGEEASLPTIATD